MMTRPCGCPTNAPAHAAIEPDWIGNTPIMHGESERPVPGTSHMLYGRPSIPDNYCLCGHAPYQHCPGTWPETYDTGAWGGTVMNLEIGAPE